MKREKNGLYNNEHRQKDGVGGLRPDELLDSIGGADKKYVEEAEKRVSPAVKLYNRTNRWLLPAAACLCFIAVAAVVLSSLGSGLPDTAHDGLYPDGSSAAAVTGEGVTIPKMEVSVSHGGATADMIAFFIYNGRSYVEYYRLPAESDLLGEHLGKAMGGIDEWTSPDDYIELSGSISGDFYAVKGYPPEFMLCMRMGDGSIYVFINDNDMTISKGAEIFEDRLHISENTVSVRWQSDDSWFYGKNEIYRLDDPSRSEVSEFIQAIDEGDWILRSPDDGIINNRRLHLYFDSAGGLPVNIIIYDGGYAALQGMYSVYVKCDESRLEPLVSLLEAGGAGSYVGDTDRLYLTFEDCLSDPYLGKYVPRYVPEGMEFQYAVKSCDIDAETGAVGAVKSIEIGFAGKGSYNIVITDETLTANDTAAPVFDLDTVTLRDVEAGTETTLLNDGKVRNVSTAIGLRSENAVIAVYAYGMDAGTVYDIIRSIG